MDHAAWSAVDDLLDATLLAPDPVLAAVLAHNADQGLPAIDVSPTQGKLLMLLCRLTGARTVLEVGTLGGYSTIWLTRGLPADGVVVTLEVDPHHAATARHNLAVAGVDHQVDLRVGPAADSLLHLPDHPGVPFDVVFIDADKPSNTIYLEWALRLARPGALVILDNVVRGGEVVDGASQDESVIGARRALEMLRDDPRIDATAVQTVGAKGWDGLALGIVTDATTSGDHPDLHDRSA